MMIRAFTLFDFLQYVDEADERNDADARRIVSEYFAQKYPDMPSMRSGMTPFVNLKTTLVLLVMPICYAARHPESDWDQAGWRISDRYKIEFQPRRHGVAVPVNEVLRTIRNAVAHAPDFMFGNNDKNISWDSEYIIKFSSFRPSGALRSSVVFHSEGGLLEFLSDFVKYTKRAMARSMRSGDA
jgi:hypothetical protein